MGLQESIISIIKILHNYFDTDLYINDSNIDEYLQTFGISSSTLEIEESNVCKIIKNLQTDINRLFSCVFRCITSKCKSTQESSLIYFYLMNEEMIKLLIG